MTDNSSTPAEPGSSQAPQARRRRVLTTSLLVAGAFAAGFASAVATTAFSDAGRFGPALGWHGAGPMGAMMGGPMGRRGGWMGSATVEERAERMVRRLAVEIDATDEQRDRLVAIARGSAEELNPLRERLRDAREEARTLLTAETINRDAIEAFRAEQIALADTASRRLAEALGDAAEVLTPEQRAELASLVDRWRERHGRRHRH